MEPEALNGKPPMIRIDPVRWIAKPAVFAAASSPFVWLAGSFVLAPDALGANPIEYAIRFCGDWALRFLLISLCVTPVNEILSAPVVMRFRRMLGLFAFFYAFLHLAAYVGLDQFFDFAAIWEDIVKRRYITIGMLGFALLVPLAITSTKGWIRRLTAPRWIRLHKLVYPAAIAACVHYFMMVKADIREPLIYGAILATLLGYRYVARTRRRIRRRRRKATMAAAAQGG